MSNGVVTSSITGMACMNKRTVPAHKATYGDMPVKNNVRPQKMEKVITLRVNAMEWLQIQGRPKPWDNIVAIRCNESYTQHLDLLGQ